MNITAAGPHVFCCFHWFLVAIFIAERPLPRMTIQTAQHSIGSFLYQKDFNKSIRKTCLCHLLKGMFAQPESDLYSESEMFNWFLRNCESWGIHLEVSELQCWKMKPKNKDLISPKTWKNLQKKSQIYFEYRIFQGGHLRKGFFRRQFSVVNLLQPWGALNSFWRRKETIWKLSNLMFFHVFFSESSGDAIVFIMKHHQLGNMCLLFPHPSRPVAKSLS